MKMNELFPQILVIFSEMPNKCGFRVRQSTFKIVKIPFKTIFMYITLTGNIYRAVFSKCFLDCGVPMTQKFCISCIENAGAKMLSKLILKRTMFQTTTSLNDELLPK